VAVARSKTEEDHQLTKQVSGLDRGQVTTRTSWHRWTAISLLAAAFLAVAAAWQRVRDGSTAALELIPVTVPELLRQLRGTVIANLGRAGSPCTGNRSWGVVLITDNRGFGAWPCLRSRGEWVHRGLFHCGREALVREPVA